MCLFTIASLKLYLYMWIPTIYLHQQKQALLKEAAFGGQGNIYSVLYKSYHTVKIHGR